MPESFRWQLTDSDPQQTLFHDDPLERRKGIGEFRDLEFLLVRAKKIINEVSEQTAMPFRFTINAYRGCSHACVYCFARPTHEYLNFNLGSDFDSKIVVKVNAVERVRAELRNKRWSGEGIAMGTNTDPYQRAEGKFQLTRGIVRELSEARNPFSILTKSTLILRDAELLAAASERTSVQANFSIASLDTDVWRRTEPGTPHPRQRVAAVKRLTAAGIETGVLMAPVLPGLSDRPEQLAAVVEACVDAGATWIAASPLHLKLGVKQHWMAWLEQEYPELLRDYRARYADRGYLPGSDRQDLSKQVSTLACEARSRLGPPAPAPARAPRSRLDSRGMSGRSAEGAKTVDQTLPLDFKPNNTKRRQ